MSKPTVSISSITFSDGQTFQLKSKDKVILVGPNNSGKSLTLREIALSLHNTNFNNNLSVKEVELEKKGTVEDLRNFLDTYGTLGTSTYYYNNWAINESHIARWEMPYLSGNLSNGFIKNVTAEARLSICAQQPNIPVGEQKTVPQHVLYDDDALMKRTSKLFFEAFNKDLFIDFRGGQQIPIHVGEQPVPEKGSDRVSDNFVEKVRKFPLLDKQGDGMKSYAGILFEAVVTNRDITMIDEPEAFLHPPQMRRLGETLAKEVKGQLIVATHSSDIMRGFLSGTKGNVRILRIKQENNENHVTETSPEVIKKLWEHPELRYSNGLESIFHEQAIICEDDSDCRLINSVADYLESGSKDYWKDTAYVPTGGKHGIPKIAEALRNIGVPIKAVFDIDFLSERNLVKKTIQAFGGKWEDFEPIWKKVDAAVRDGNKPKSAPEIKQDLINLLEKLPSDDLPKGEIESLMKQGTSWSKVKKFGVRTGVPKGQAQKDFKSLDIKLQSIGIYVVKVGEVENFCPEVGLHGPKFVSKLLSSMKLGDDELKDLRSFVELVHQGTAG